MMMLWKFRGIREHHNHRHTDKNLCSNCKLFRSLDSLGLISIVSRAEAEVVATYVVTNMGNWSTENSEIRLRRHRCEYCQKEFLVSYFLRKHMDECHPSAVSAESSTHIQEDQSSEPSESRSIAQTSNDKTCKLCSKTLSNSFSLTRHIMTVHIDKDKSRPRGRPRKRRRIDSRLSADSDFSGTASEEPTEEIASEEDEANLANEDTIAIDCSIIRGPGIGQVLPTPLHSSSMSI